MIVSLHGDKWIQCSSVIQSEHQTVISSGTRRQMGCRASWDFNNALQTPESCLRAVTTMCLKLLCQNVCFFFAALESCFFSQLAADTNTSVYTRYRGVFLSFESPRNLVQQHFRGSRWRCAMSYIKSDDLLCVFMRPRVLFCVFPKMKVCFRCSFQSLRRARHRQGWLQFARSSVAAMDGWHVWSH